VGSTSNYDDIINIIEGTLASIFRQGGLRKENEGA